MNIAQRIKNHQDVVAALEKRRAERLEFVAQDLQHRRDMLDGDDLRSHAHVLDTIDDKIAVAKALIQELQVLEILSKRESAGAS